MQDLNPRRTLRAFTQEGCDLHTQEGCDLHTQEGCDLHYQCKDGVTVAEDCDGCRHVSGSNLRGAITEDGVHYVALRLSLTKRQRERGSVVIHRWYRTDERSLAHPLRICCTDTAKILRQVLQFTCTDVPQGVL